MLTSDNSILRIENQNDLHEIIKFLRGFSFKRSDRKEAHEILCLYIYIVALIKASKLKLPITIEKKESPDFRIFLDDKKNPIGLEHTQATLEQFKMAYSEFKKKSKGCLMEPLFYSPFKKLPKLNINIGIRNPNEELKCLPSCGYDIELEWATTIKNAIIQKTKILNRNHFQKFSRNELLIEDQSPTKLFKEDDIAFDFLDNFKKEIEFETGPITFNKIHIFTVNDFIYDFFDEKLIIDMSKKNL